MGIVGAPYHPGRVDVTAALTKVPADNLRIPREAFGHLWAQVERWGSQPGPDNHYLVGVIWTCRWLSGQPVWSRIDKRMEVPKSPFTRCTHAAMPETIEAEYITAATACRRPGQHTSRIELAHGVVATLDWTWNGGPRPQLDMPAAATG